MRVVSGIYGGRKLLVPKGRDIRPTSDKVRGAIFNALRSRMDIKGAHVLDGFCGTGALGLEALSQRATSCTFIDSARTSMDLTKKNVQILGAENTHFILKDVTKLGPRPEDIPLADLVFLDPPYHENFLISSLLILHNSKWIRENAIIVGEVERVFNEALPAEYKMLDRKNYGDTDVIFAQYG